MQPAPGGPCVSHHAVFWAAVGKSLALCLQTQAKIDGVFGHNISSVAAEPFHVLHVNLMSDDSMCKDHFFLNFKREAWSLCVNFLG